MAPALLVSAGCLNVDLVARVPALPGPDGRAMSDGFARMPGGMAGNVSVAAAQVGASQRDANLSIKVIAPVGNDDAGRWLVDDLEHAGVGTRWLDRSGSPHTTHCLILVPPGGERAIVSEPSRLDAGHVQRAVEALGAGADRPRHLHVDGFHADNCQALALASRARGWSTSVDLDELDADDYAPARFEALCAAYGMVFINRTNAERLTGSERPADWTKTLADLSQRTGTRFILTLGAGGAQAIAPGVDPLVVPGHRVDVVDSTGAGDCLAGTLLAHLLAGRSLGEALVLANQAAAKSTTFFGARGSG